MNISYYHEIYRQMAKFFYSVRARDLLRSPAERLVRWVDGNQCGLCEAGTSPSLRCCFCLTELHRVKKRKKKKEKKSPGKHSKSSSKNKSMYGVFQENHSALYTQ